MDGINIDKAKLINGWMDDNELQTIAEWASKRNHIIEIGTWKGRTTRAICDNTKDTVITIDNWKGAIEPVDNGFWELDKYGSDYVYNMFHKNLQDHIDNQKLFVYDMDSVLAAKMLIRKYGFEQFDMIFIDGGHEYEIVKRDMIFFRPLLRMGGQMCGHDVCYPGVKKALDELFPQYWTQGNLWSKEV